MKTKDEWRLLKDEAGYFVALQRPDGSYAQRTLCTRDQEKAEAWLRRSVCHGLRHHTQDCDDCRPRSAATPARAKRGTCEAGLLRACGVSVGVALCECCGLVLCGKHRYDGHEPPVEETVEEEAERLTGGGA